MNIEDFREYCLKLDDGVEESFPFDNDTLVFKVKNKIFALANVEKFEFINMKCNPEKALELRENYNGIEPGYHMNKKHWNSVYLNKDVKDILVKELIQHSFDLIY